MEMKYGEVTFLWCVERLSSGERERMMSEVG